MRLTGSRAYTRPQPVPKMPTGLVELMEDLTRDVLKQNPTDVYEFCADHMRKLLDIRDGPSKRRPLTLEEKIARAQEIVKKRGEARWKKYVKQQRIDQNTSKVQSGPENILYNENTSTKPPVYPDLNKEKSSGTEISHEPGSVIHSPMKPDSNLNINTVIEDHTNYHETEKVLSDRPAFTDSLPTNEKFNDNFVSEDNLTTEIKDENLPNLMLAENIDEDAVNVKKEELFNASNMLNIEDEEKTNSKISTTQETSLPEKEMVKRTDSPTEIQTKSDIGEVVSTAIGMLNTINESSVNSSEKQYYVEDITSTQDKINVQTDFEEIKEKTDSKIISTRGNGSSDIDMVIHGESEQETNNQGNNSISDMGHIVNTAISVVNIINPSPRSPIQKIEACEAVNDINNHFPLESLENNTLQTNVKQKNEHEPSMPKEIVSSDQTVNTPNQGTEFQAPTSLGDMGKVVNAAIGILNIINESPRSQNQHTQSLEGINRDDSNSDLLQTQHDSQRDLSNKIDMSHVDNVTNVENKDNKLLKSVVSEDPALESSLKVHNIQGNQDVDDDSRKQENIMTNLSNTEDVKNDILITINESDHMKIDDGTTTTEESKAGDGFENDTIESMNVVSGNDLELYNKPITNDKGSFKDVDSLSSKEPLVNAVIINETGKVQEELTEGKIEIRITQVAEALNNEVPLTIENLSISDESSPSNSSPNKTKNASDLQVENNNTDIYLGTKEIDSEANVTSVNLDDVPNKNIKSAIKSTSIDESIDGTDNTCLIESGTSDATDDMFLNNTNSNNMDLETAAVTIQKVFRSFMFKSRASTFDDNDENISLDEENDKKDESEFQTPNINKERRGISRMDTVLQTVNEEKSLSLSTDDSSTISSAATTIQAHVRGFLVRNKLHSNKTASSNSLVNSDGHDDCEIDHKNSKTILNIHIVPEGGNYLSRDESVLTSMDLSLDGSPPSSLNLHPLGYDKNERRKLKREDAIQSISPPSNNSGKLSEESVKDMLITESDQNNQKDDKKDIDKNDNIGNGNGQGSLDTSATNTPTIDTVIEANELVDQECSDAGATPVKTAQLDASSSNIPTIETVTEPHVDQDSSDGDTATPIQITEVNTSLTAETLKLADKESSDVLVRNGKGSLTKQSSDEMDVVTPFEDKISLANSTSTSKLMHSGEFHDIVLPTKVSRGDASVVSEFKNVLVYFLLWNNS